MRRFRIFVSLFAAAALTGCQKVQEDIQQVNTQPPLFDGMGHHFRWITTDVPEAQAYFNQGLTWAFAFNHDEAIRAFKEAARHDPKSPMPWWGIALCNGPHINNPVMTPDMRRNAWDALQKALERKNNGSYLEQTLVEALAARYSADLSAERRPLDEAYAKAMKERYELDINDADVAALYAEALMDLQPWDLWDKDGKPKGNTEEILSVLEYGLKINPHHPGLTHLYIHAIEASPFPEKGIAAADELRELVPISGHLTHMPSHIDVQIGRWAQASMTNEKAIEADRRYRAISPRQGFYNVYMLHNRHFLAFSSMMEGRSEVALRAAREMLANVPKAFLRDHAELADPFLSTVLDVLKRFGRWDEVLKEPKPGKSFPIASAMWHYARGIAYAAKGEIRQSKREQQAFRAAVGKVPEGALTGINPAHKVLKIADHMLEAEIAYREGRMDVAKAQLREGIRIEDDLLYMEPPEWIQPVRHTLGAFLLDAAHKAPDEPTRLRNLKEAEEVYRKDLEIWPENGWSLYGLAQCLRGRGEITEAGEVEARFKKTWARADVKIGSSCLCVPSLAACCKQSPDAGDVRTAAGRRRGEGN